MLNGIVSLIFLSDSLLLLYRNATDFCILILYPATLPNSFMSSRSFLVASLDFLCMVSCHLQTVTVLLSFPIWIPFISLSCLNAMARISNTMLNKIGWSGHPCLVPDLRGNVFSFSLWNMMLAEVCYIWVLRWPLLRYVPSMPTFRRVF